MRLRLLVAVLLSLAASTAWAATYVGTGSTTVTAGTGTCTPASAGVTWQANDLLLVVTESENQAISLSTANGFVEVGAQASQSAGTAATDPASRLAVWYKIATSSSDSMPVVADSGDHTSCKLYVFRGVYTTSPFDATASGNDSGANDTSGVIPSLTTNYSGEMVVLITSSSNNGTSTTQCSAWTNANLTSLTERGDSTNTSGLGGGHCLATGVDTTAGSIGTTTVTMAATTYKGALALALRDNPDGSATVTGLAGTGAVGNVTSEGTDANAIAYDSSFNSGAPLSVNCPAPNSQGACTTGSQTTAGAAVIAVMVTIPGNSGTPESCSTVTDSVDGATGWSLAVRSNLAGTQTAGSAEIWTKRFSSAMSSRTISCNYSSTTFSLGGLMSVAAFTNVASSSWVGATCQDPADQTVASAGTSRTFSCSLNVQATGSVLLAAFDDWMPGCGTQCATAASGQTIISDRYQSTATDNWTQRKTNPTTATGTYAMTVTTPTGSTGNAVGIELLKGGGDASATITGASATGAVGNVTSDGGGLTIYASCESGYGSGTLNKDCTVSIPDNAMVVMIVHMQSGGLPLANIDPGGANVAMTEIGNSNSGNWGTWAFKYWNASSRGSVTVRARRDSGTTWDGAQETYVFTGSSSTGIGATVGAGNTTTNAPMRTSITSQANGSILMWGIAWHPQDTTTAYSNNSILTHYDGDGGSDSGASGRYNGTPTAGTYTIGLNETYLGSSVGWWLYGVEVKAAGGSGDGTATITGTSGTGALGSVTSTGDSAATITGSAGTGAVGAFYGGGGAALAQRTATGAPGALVAGGGGGLAGQTGTGAPGAVSASGGGTAGPSGVTATGFVGNVSGSGTGGGEATITGTTGAGAPGNVSSSGAAASSPSAIAATGFVGNVSASGASAGTANLTGVTGAGAFGNTTSSGDAARSPTGATATGAVGAFAAGGGASLTTRSGTGAAGNVTASTSASVTLTSQTSTGAVGNMTGSGGSDGTATLTTRAGSGVVGNVSASGSSSVTVAGVAGSGGTGNITSTGNASRTVTGAAGSGFSGAVTASGGTAATLTTMAGTGAAKAISSVGSAVATLGRVVATGLPGSIVYVDVAHAVSAVVKTVRPVLDALETVRPDTAARTVRPSADVQTPR